jgi:hypothetical protein
MVCTFTVRLCYAPGAHLNVSSRNMRCCGRIEKRCNGLCIVRLSFGARKRFREWVKNGLLTAVACLLNLLQRGGAGAPKQSREPRHGGDRGSAGGGGGGIKLNKYLHNRLSIVVWCTVLFRELRPLLCRARMS